MWISRWVLLVREAAFRGKEGKWSVFAGVVMFVAVRVVVTLLLIAGLVWLSRALGLG